MLVTGDNPVYAKIVEALGLKGQNAYTVTVRIAIGEPVTATVERRLTKEEVGKLAELMPDLQPFMPFATNAYPWQRNPDGTMKALQPPKCICAYTSREEAETAKANGTHLAGCPFGPPSYKTPEEAITASADMDSRVNGLCGKGWLFVRHPDGLSEIKFSKFVGKHKYGGIACDIGVAVRMAESYESANFANVKPIQEGEQYPSIGKDEEWVDLPPVIKSFKQLVKSVYPLAHAKKLVNGWSIHSGGLLPMIDMIAFEETEYKAWEKAAEPFVSTLPKGHGLTQGWLNRQIEKAADTVKSLPEWMQKSCTCPVEVLTLSGCKCGGK